MLFTPGEMGSLMLHNRVIRSATAERMADEEGFPRSELGDMYRELVLGEVGLIITGHMYIDQRGKCHPEMTGISREDHIAALKKLTELVHAEEGRIAVQINHGGGQCAAETVPTPLAPSSQVEGVFKRQPQDMTCEDIENAIQAYAQAAGRAVEAGFDAVQIHAAHGYLISQFTSPLSNHRQDQWGGSTKNRARFLRRVCQSIRQKIGYDFPLFIKYGIADGKENGLSLSEGADILSQFQKWGLDGVEISVGFSGESLRSIQKGITTPEEEGYLMPLVKKAREVTELPLMAVGGFRSRSVMEQVLLGGWADFISMSRPLIREPQFPRRMMSGDQDQSKCISANHCWPESVGAGIGCKCPPLPEDKRSEP